MRNDCLLCRRGDTACTIHMKNPEAGPVRPRKPKTFWSWLRELVKHESK